MGTKPETEILNVLLDNYEKSKSFTGTNKNTQTFKVSIGSLFPRYLDHAEFEYYTKLNASVAFLLSKDFVSVTKKKSGEITYVTLNVAKLDDIYAYVKRIPRRKIQDEILRLLVFYGNADNYTGIRTGGTDSINVGAEIFLQKALCKDGKIPVVKETRNIFRREEENPLILYAENQKQRIEKNQNVLFFEGDMAEYNDVLRAAKAVWENREEIFIRELSVKLFNNSKQLEKLESKVRSLLFAYGSYEDKDTVFEEHNVIKTPTYVMVKGCGVLDCGETIDLSKIKGDLGLSTATLKALKHVTLGGAGVITIENLTAFHRYEPKNEMAVYLGGFHNQVKRDFLTMVYAENPGCRFRHFGDIDAGGFYILEHLKLKTGVAFEPWGMDCAVLEKYKDNVLPLTDRDRKRIQDLLEKDLPYKDVLEYMLAHNCKLEQEAVV